MRDPYEILQVSRNADREAIEAAFRQLARRYHPDLNPSIDAEARMKDLNWAYHILHDPVKRSTYDRSRSDIQTEHTSRSPEPSAQPPSTARPHRQTQTSIHNRSSLGRPQVSSIPRQEKTSFSRLIWIIAAIIASAYFAFFGDEQVPSSEEYQPNALVPTENVYTGCIPWTQARLYDGLAVCVFGRIVSVTYEFDYVVGAHIWTAHFGDDSSNDFKLITVGRNISHWKGQCVAVRGTLSNRGPIRDYLDSPQPSMINSDPYSKPDFHIVEADRGLCD